MRNEIIYFSARHLSLSVPFFAGSLGIIMNDNTLMKHTEKKNVGVLYQQTTHVRLKTNPEK
jgi:hypothetical protein